MRIRPLFSLSATIVGSSVISGNCPEARSRPLFPKADSNLIHEEEYTLNALSVSRTIPSDSREVKSFTLMEEESFGQLKIGVLGTEIVRLLGNPEKKGRNILQAADGLYHQNWFYPKKGITLDMVSETANGTRKVGSVKLVSPSKLKTKRGIGIGSPYREVERAYAQERDRESSIGVETFVAGSPYGGLIFSFKNGRVTEIFLGAGAE